LAHVVMLPDFRVLFKVQLTKTKVKPILIKSLKVKLGDYDRLS
jgi:hypothetical protein